MNNLYNKINIYFSLSALVLSSFLFSENFSSVYGRAFSEYFYTKEYISSGSEFIFYNLYYFSAMHLEKIGIEHYFQEFILGIYSIYLLHKKAFVFKSSYKDISFLVSFLNPFVLVLLFAPGRTALTLIFTIFLLRSIKSRKILTFIFSSVGMLYTHYETWILCVALAAYFEYGMLVESNIFSKKLRFPFELLMFFVLAFITLTVYSSGIDYFDVVDESSSKLIYLCFISNFATIAFNCNKRSIFIFLFICFFTTYICSLNPAYIYRIIIIPLLICIAVYQIKGRD